MIPIGAVKNFTTKVFNSLHIFGAFRDIAETCSSDKEPAISCVCLTISRVRKIHSPDVFILEPPGGDALLSQVNILKTVACGRYVVDV